MSIWAIIPVKPMKSAKSRLAGVLSPEEREKLSREFLSLALEVLGETPGIERRLVVSRDLSALAIARDYGAKTLMEDGAPLLNVGLTRATILAQTYGAGAVLIMHADLPFLTVEEVTSLIEACSSKAGVAIAPDRHEQGTNALLVRPPGLIQYAFGPGSYVEHVRRAETAGVRVTVCRMPGLALDIDVPADLELYRHKVIERT